MFRTLGISPKVIAPLIGHLVVCIALLVSGHADLAWGYAATALPVNGILGFLASAGIVVPVAGAHLAEPEGEPFVTEPYAANTGGGSVDLGTVTYGQPDAPAPALLSDEGAAMIARQLALLAQPTAH